MDDHALFHCRAAVDLNTAVIPPEDGAVAQIAIVADDHVPDDLAVSLTYAPLPMQGLFPSNSNSI